MRQNLEPNLEGTQPSNPTQFPFAKKVHQSETKRKLNSTHFFKAKCFMVLRSIRSTPYYYRCRYIANTNTSPAAQSRCDAARYTVHLETRILIGQTRMHPRTDPVDAVE